MLIIVSSQISDEKHQANSVNKRHVLIVALKAERSRVRDFQLSESCAVVCCQSSQISQGPLMFILQGKTPVMGPNNIITPKSVKKSAEDYV